jgi:hypothetical protein
MILKVASLISSETQKPLIDLRVSEMLAKSEAHKLLSLRYLRPLIDDNDDGKK